MIQFDKRLPVYEQIIDYVKKQIVSGEWELGKELPSRREFASQLQVNPNTVQRAFREMEEMGLISTGNNVMSRVTDNPELIGQLKQEMLQEAINICRFYLSITCFERGSHGTVGTSDEEKRGRVAC